MLSMGRGEELNGEDGVVCGADERTFQAERRVENCKLNTSRLLSYYLNGKNDVAEEPQVFLTVSPRALFLTLYRTFLEDWSTVRNGRFVFLDLLIDQGAF